MSKGKTWDLLTEAEQSAASRDGYPRSKYPEDYWHWVFDKDGRCIAVHDNGETLKPWFSVPK